MTGIFLGLQAQALPTLKLNSRQAFPATFTTDYDFSGIVALDNCSGSLVRFTQSADTDHAMVLTNGHCVESGFPSAGEVIYRQDSSRNFRLLKSDGSEAGNITATQIIYATMTNTDMALYRTQETYSEIQSKFGIAALQLAATHPLAGVGIEVISGYWGRGFTCAIETFVNQLKEDQWTWVDSMRYSRPGCETYGGTSGSPVLAAGSRVVIGINNTGNESSLECTVNNPCEVDREHYIWSC